MTARSVSARRTWPGDWTASDYRRGAEGVRESLTTLIPQPLQRLRRLYEPSLGMHGKNTVDRAVENIVRHYDLSNELFALFLDETMTYSCAVFEAGDSLAQAQERKYERLCHAATHRRRSSARDRHRLGWDGHARGPQPGLSGDQRHNLPEPACSRSSASPPRDSRIG